MAERARRRRARRIGAVGFAVAVALPLTLWHRVIADIASEFRLDPRYLVTGWTPWVLMLLGLCCFIPVVLEDWRALAPSSRGANVELTTPSGRVEGVAAGIELRPPLSGPIVSVSVNGSAHADFDAQSVTIASAPAQIVCYTAASA